jgi:hypothetical protein
MYSVIAVSFYEDSSLRNYLQLVLSPFRIIITILAGYCLVQMFFNKGYNEKQILKFIFIACVAHAIIMILQLLYPEFKEFIYSYTTNFKNVGFENYQYEYHFRMGGLSGGFGSAVLSVSMAIPLLLFPQIISKESFYNRYVLYLGALLIIFSILISGRSGIFVLLFFAPIAFYLNTSIHNKLNGLIVVLKFFSFLIMGLLLVLNILAIFDNESDIFYAMSRSLETFTNFQRGIYKDNTVSVLTEHLIFPKSLSTWIIGDSVNIYKTQFDRVLKSDIGFVKNIWSLGVFVSLLYWLPYFYLIFASFNKIKNKFGINLFLILSVTIFFQFKEDVFYSRILCSYLGLFLGFYCIEKLKIKN